MYETGSIQTQKFKYSGENFTYLPDKSKRHLKISFSENGDRRKTYVRVGYDESFDIDCFGKKECLHLLGKIRDNAAMTKETENTFDGVLTSKGLNITTFKEKILKSLE